MSVFKLLAGLFAVSGLVSGSGVFVTTFWLLKQTANDPNASKMGYRVRSVPAAAVRGEWPDLSSARWYRRFFRAMLLSWIGGVLCVMVHEVFR